MPSASIRPAATSSAEVLGRLDVRDPDFWLGALCWGVIAFSCVQLTLFGFGRDQGIYALVADAVLRGQMPYRDVWDFKPPGIFVVYALAQALFGKTMLAPRLLEVLGLLLVVMCMRRLSSVFVGSTRPGLLAGALAALLHAQMEFWHTGQPESFGGFLTLYALALTATEYPRRWRWLVWIAIGLLFGAAFLLKPPLGGGALACAAFLAGRELGGQRFAARALLPLVVISAAFVVPIAACAAWFALGGAWGDLAWTLFEFTPGYTTLSWEGQSAPEVFYYGLEELFFRFSALLAAGVIALLAISPMHGRERQGLFLVLGVLSVHLAGIAMQGKFFQYHYAASLPLVALLAGVGLYKLWRRCLAAGGSGVLAYVSFLLVAASMRTPVRDLSEGFWWRSALRTQWLLGVAPFSSREVLDSELYRVSDYNLGADHRVAHAIRRFTAPGERVFVWGFEPVIYWLSNRPPASRFIYNVPQRAQWEREFARSELRRELGAKPPEAIVVQRNDVMPVVTGGWSDSRAALGSFPWLDELIKEQYERVSTIEDFDLYARRAETAQVDVQR